MALPEVGQPTNIDIIRRQRPDFDSRAERFRFLRDALTGGGGFSPYMSDFDATTGRPATDLQERRTYLRKYVRETPAKWKRRVMSAYYPNYLEWIVRIWLGLFTRETPAREGYIKAVTDWMDRPGPSGDTFETLMADVFLYWWFCYGEMYAIVQGPKPQPEGEEPPASAAQETGDVYLTEVHPDNVLEAPEDDEGRLLYFKYMSPIPAQPDPLSSSSRPGGVRVNILTHEGAWWYDIKEDERQGEVNVAGVHPWPRHIVDAGVVPVARLMRPGISQSPIFFLAQTMLRLFNVLSMLGEIEDLSCFPVLAWPVTSPDEIKKINWGTSTAVPFMGTAAPRFIGYDAAPLEHLLGRIEGLTTELKRLSALVMDQSTGQSGLAKAYAFLQTDRTVTSFVSPIERFDAEVGNLVALWKGNAGGLPDDARPGYPRSFDVQEVTEAVAVAAELIDMGLGPVAERLTKRLAFYKLHQALGSDDAAEVDREFKEMAAAASGEPDNPDADDLEALAAALKSQTPQSDDDGAGPFPRPGGAVEPR